MAEGSLRALKSTALSGGTEMSATAFDLHSWQGLTGVLQSARSSLAPHEYSAFRDLVLEYAQSGGTPEIRQKIDLILQSCIKNTKSVESQSMGKHDTSTPADQIQNSSIAEVPQTPKPLNDFHEKPVAQPKAVVPTPASHHFSRMGVGRPAPVFKAHNRSEVAATHTPQESAAPMTQQAPKQENPAPPLTPRVPLPEPVVTDVVGETLRVAPMTLSLEKQPVQTVEEYKARIIEIKRDVHTRFGNPVMLIDSENKVGREYMNALLEAVKASGGGRPGVLLTAMEALERAYASLCAVGLTPPDVTKQTVEIQHEVPSGTPADPLKASRTEIHKPSPLSTKPLKKEVPTETPVAQEPRMIPQREIVKNNPPQQSARKIEPARYGEQSKTQVPTLQDLLAMKRGGDFVQPPKNHAATQHREGKVQTETLTPPRTSIDVDRTQGFAQRAESVQVADALSTESSAQISTPLVTHRFSKKTEPQRVEGAKSIASTDDVPPLFPKSEALKNIEQSETYSTEVTEALGRLLEEWPLFKSSGIFGTGPGGSNHPLYRKLSEIPMGSLLGGRWNDANPEIIKSIKDYVNAWRHEQGIAYTVDESFEEYLRRVIVKILKRQK